MRARRARRPLAVLLALVAGLATLVAVPGERAAAADLRQFDPGLIISDSIFYDSASMTAAQVQSFLDAKGAGCSPAAGSTCLKDYRQTTTSRAADDRCTGGYAGAANETAAQIISKVATACGINPQVILVTLQKEQGLVTASAGRSAAVYQKAMGYGCPDTAACDSLYYGFANQVYSAARQFQNYAARPTSYAHRAGMVNQVRFHPNAACGSSAVLIQNQATASLYNYTPYQPNAAAIAAGYGTGDSCSSYGNRNFWNYFTDWFGSTTQRVPVGSLDEVTPAGAGTARVRGWAFDPDTTSAIAVHVYVDGKAVRAAAASTSRPDVGTAYGRGANHGFDTTVTMAAGTHQVCVYAIDSAGGGSPQIGCRPVTVTNTPPIGSVDSVTAAGPGTVQVRGWVLDPDTRDPIRAHVYVDGKGVASIAADQTRADVDRAYGMGAAHGYDTTLRLATGPHEVCVYAIDATGGTNPKVGCRTVTVGNKVPLGSLDSVTSAGPASVRVRGWALDPDTRDPIRAHVYVDGKGVASIAADQTRADVDRAYGMGAAHGYDTVLTLANGQHEVCVYAIDATGGTNPKVGCRTVTVNNRAPIGSLDVLQGGMEKLTLSGWALDPDTRDPIQVQVQVDGTRVATLAADQTRADVDRAYGMGAEHGFATTLTAAPGTREVCLVAVDSSGGTNPRFACRTVVVNGMSIGSLDEVSSSAAGIRVRGWALDPDTTASIKVHLYVDGRMHTELRASDSRPDVHAAYGKGALHGFDTTLARPAGATSGGWPSGAHEVCLWAIDSSGGANPQVGCRTVVVP